jgi:hypothetical protein
MTALLTSALAEVAKIALPKLWAEVRRQLRSDARSELSVLQRATVYDLNRRFRISFKVNRRLPDANLDKHRAIDDIPYTPRLLTFEPNS